ncbi:MAG: PRTRC system protein E [Bacteroidota bacterium]|nr:PRTRC system protein E [Bacteroidota bacterium]
MKTNFFELVAGFSLTGNLQINIHQVEGGTQTVSVMLSAKDPKATTGKNLPPMLLKGTPQELDEAFFEQISQPIRLTEKLFANAEAYQKELEKAKKQTADNDKKPTAMPGASNKAVANTNLFSQPADEQPNKEQHDDDDDEILDEQPDNSELLMEKQRLYDEAMQRVTTLNGQMKYAEAIAQLPDPEEYPDKAEEIKNKGEALLKRQELFAVLQKEV